MKAPIDISAEAGVPVPSALRYIAGIDEAGRGALAGPVAVGCVIIKNRKACAEVLALARDSKKLSAQKRRAIFVVIKECEKKGHLAAAVGFSSSAMIDRKGIVGAVQHGLNAALKNAARKLALKEHEVSVKLDGSLKASASYIFQKTIIRGDDLVKEIGLASIVAKVSRDEFMEKMAVDFPVYGYDVHKGYGTLMHRKALKKHGISKSHRVSFLKKISG